MNKRNGMANFNILHIFMDNAVIFCSYCIANNIYWSVRGNHIFSEHIWIYAIFSVIFTLSMLFLRMYNITTFFYMDRMVKRVAASTAIAGTSLSVVVFLGKIEQTSRLLFVVFCALSCALILSERVAIRVFKKSNRGNGYSHVLFIGDDATFKQYMGFIDKTSIKLKMDDFITYNDPSLQSAEAFSQLLVKTSVDEVHFVFTFGSKDEMIAIQPLIEVCDSMGVTARVILDNLDLPVSKSYVSSIGTYPVITYHSVSLDKLQLFVKSVMDITGAVIGLILLAPVFIIAAIAIKIDSPGPVFFKQQRAGIRGNVFQIYKFRSMYVDAESRKRELESMNMFKDGMMFKIDNDPRITRVGAFLRKSSIDELPQLINVLKREMSLVGTRPPTLEEVKKYEREHWRRISIQPGITGMWQVKGRSQILDFDDVVKLDEKYIDEWSVLLDIKLILMTLKVVLSTRGAY